MLNNIGRFTQRNSPAILAGAAVGGVIATAVLAVRATPKAMKRLEEIEDLSTTRMDRVKETWKFYIPASLSAAATIACIIGANKIGARRNAALVAAYSLVEQAFREYKDKVIEEIGEARETKIRERIMQEKIDKLPGESKIIITGGGDQLCFDSFSGRQFRGSIEDIKKAANDLNQRILQNPYMAVCHNEFYELLDLPGVDAGIELGWCVDNLLELEFTGHINECGQPCIAIGYKRMPRADYDKPF